MFVAIGGMIGSPPYGTLLSSHCSGPLAQNSGRQPYVDASGATWYGMFTTWQELANGTGGSFWQSLGDNTQDTFSACWYPFGFYLQYDSGNNYTNWTGCGSSGTFGPTSYYFNYIQADGNGGTYNNSGGSDIYPAGYIIYQSGDSNCCKIYYDGSGGYYEYNLCGG